MNSLLKQPKFLLLPSKTWEEVHERSGGNSNLGKADKATIIWSCLYAQQLWENGHSFKDVRPDSLLFVRGNYPVDSENWRCYRRNEGRKKMSPHWEKEGLMRSGLHCPFYKKVEGRHDMRVWGQIKSYIHGFCFVTNTSNPGTKAMASRVICSL